MTELMCPHDDTMPAAWCSHCRGLDREERLSGEVPFGWFKAQYKGKCTNCMEWFDDGTPITRNSHGSIICCED